jgi:predicted transglutaminase-like protease
MKNFISLFFTILRFSVELNATEKTNFTSFNNKSSDIVMEMVEAVIDDNYGSEQSHKSTRQNIERDQKIQKEEELFTTKSRDSMKINLSM